jgi:hypothetical protein
MRVIYLVIVLLFSFPALSQIVEISSTVAAEVEVCVDHQTTQVKIYNLFGQTLTGVKVKVALPPGLNYLPSSLQETSSYSMQEFDVSVDTALVFSAANIPHGDSLLFEIGYSANMDAIPYQDAGYVFRNNISVLTSQVNTLKLSPAYNILYPVFSILSVSPTSQTIINGGSGQRTIEIINGGNGKTDQIKISDAINNPLLSLVGTDIGVLINDTIILSGSDFALFGNGDNYFDQYETIQITETLQGVACSDVTVSSDIKVSWGCSDLVSTASSFAHLSLDFQSPYLSLISNEELTSCFGVGQASAQELIIANDGSGIASNIVVDLFKSSGANYDQTIFSRFDPSSLKIKTNSGSSYATYSNYSATITDNSGDLACLGPSAIGKLLVNLPDILPGDSLFLVWDMYSCCVQTCQNDKIQGWRAEVSYSDVCSGPTNQVSVNGQDVNSQEMSFFTESPVEIYDGVSADFNFITSIFDNTLPQGTGAYYLMTFDLEQGLVFEDLQFTSNSVNWIPFWLDYDIIQNQVKAKFLVPAPFTVPKSELLLSISGDCGISDWKNISLSAAYVPDSSCSSCEIPLECSVTVSTFLNCPAGPCSSLKVLSFNAERTSLGLPDNNFDGVADNSGLLNMNLIKMNRAMVGDTIEAVSRAVIGSTTEDWQYGAFKSQIDHGAVLESLPADVEIYDVSENVMYSIPGVNSITSSSGNAADFYFDLSIVNLANYNTDLSAYTFEQGDSITIKMPYKVIASVTGLLKETTFINEFYLSHNANPESIEKDYCDFKHGRITLIGYSWRNNGPNNSTVSSCSKVLNQNFGMSIGGGGSNYAGGNLFPYEYRNWAKLKEAWMIIPAHYSYVNSVVKQTRTKATNSKQTQTLTIAPDAINGDTLYFNMEQYYGSGLSYSDDGFNGELQVELSPSCDVPQNTYQDVTWIFNYDKSGALDNQESGHVNASSPDQIKYAPSALQLSSSNPWIDALQRNVIWNYKVKNASTSNADFAWVHIDAPANILIDSITTSNGMLLVQQNDLYLIGGINSNSTANLSIHGTFSNCDTLLLDVYSGFECTGYPTDFSTFQCAFEHLVLYVEPKPAAYQTRILSQLMADPCSPQIELTVDITSVKMANMYDMSIDLISADTSKIKVVSATSQFQYNVSNTPISISDPSFNTNTYSFDINNYEGSFVAEGIPGVLDISNNRYKLSTIIELGSQFKQGDFLQIKINGANACDVSLPTINLAYDPNSKFEKDLTAGLHLDIGESWTASWGDYDNDGFDDLFVPVKTLNQPNILYHNNTDGTFTKVTSGPIVSDLGASVSGTWGDYDNDGFLDLFVANNENSSNKLYHNNGDATFTSVVSNPIVDLGIYSHSAAWADYNKDGFLDIVVSDFHPTNYNFLFLGDGQGGFTVDASSEVSMSASSAVGVAWGDYDNDGDLDLFIANTNAENNQLFKNINGILVNETTGPVVNDAGHSVGGTWGDYDNDGDLDLYVTNSRDIEPNFFYQNNGDGTFLKVTNSEIVNHLSNSHGASWIDFDNDGDLDLLVANDQNQQNFLYSNNGDGTFEKLVNAITQDLNDSYGTAWSDYDNDGDYDLFVANIGANANEFFVNQKGSCTNHLVVKLNGCNSNKFGVGAMVRVKATIDGQTKWQTRHVSTQTSAMGGQNSSKLLFGLLDAQGVDSVVVVWPSGVVSYILDPVINNMLTVYEDCGSKICGTVYFDENQNNVQDPSELGIPNQKITVTPGDVQVYTDQNGAYAFFVSDGDYTISQELSGDWNQFSPFGEYTINVNQISAVEYCGNDFGNTNSCLSPDLEISLGTAAFRKGLTNEFQVLIKNSGAYNTSDLVQVSIEFSENTFLVDNSWSSYTEGNGTRTYIYDLNQIMALSDTMLTLTDSVANNSLLEEIVTVTGSIIYAGSECTISSNIASLNDIVVGSIDPNDKLVFVQGRGVQKTVSTSERLIYKIRFQNVGTYAARRVFLSDQLSPDLDWTSFKFMSSSHPFEYILKGGLLTFVNNNIELPDSTSDLEGSNGYVEFSVGIKSSVNPFNVIDNKAFIQFDYNHFIETNVVGIVVVPSGYQIDLHVFTYPNPTASEINVILVDEDQNKREIKRVEIANLQGQVLRTIDVDSNEVSIDFSFENKGIYFLNVFDVNESKFTSKVIRQ